MNKKIIIRTFALLIIISAIFSLHVHTKAENNFSGILYREGSPDSRKVALTFDDGPNEPYTSQILDTLKMFDVKATFFMIGKYVEDWPDTVKRMVKEGHAIGNHSYSHPDLKFEPKRVVIKQIKKAEDAIFNASGARPYLFRPPYGHYNANIVNEAKDMGYFVILWSVSAKDGGRPRIKPMTILKKIIPKVKNGSIILLHDGDNFVKGENRSADVKALSAIIMHLKEDGYEFVTVSELLGLEQKK